MASEPEDNDDFVPPPRLLSSGVESVDPEDHELGVLHIEADFLTLSMAINKEVATELRNALDLFIKGLAPFTNDDPTEN